MDWHGRVIDFSSVELNGGHRLARGLRFLGLDCGGTYRVLTHGEAPPAWTFVGTQPAPDTGLVGKGFNFATSGSIYFNDIDANVRITDAVSFLCFFQKTGTVGAWARPFGRTTLNGGSSPYYNFDIEVNMFNNSQSRISANVNDGGSPKSTSDTYTYSDVGGGKLVAALGTAKAGGYLRLYVDGFLGPAAIAVTNVSSNNTNANLLFGGSSSAGASNGWIGFVPLGSVWDRELDADEALEARDIIFDDSPSALLLVPTFRTYWFLGAAGGATVAAGLATETDSAFGIGWSKSRPAGLAAETDAALAATARRIQALGLSAESDAALAAGHARALVPGLAGETDTAMAATARRTRAAGLATETDSAPAAGHAKAAAAGQAGETDTAPPVSAGAGVPVGQAEETDTAPATSAGRIRVVGIVSEIDSAPAAAAIRRRLVGLADEADSALAVIVRRTRTVGLSAEFDAALGASFGRAFGVGLAAETDLATVLSWRRGVTVATALETNTALALVIAATGTAIPRSGGAVTMGGGSAGLAAARAASSAAIARALGTPAVPR